jgi:hypothetical protein
MATAKTLWSRLLRFDTSSKCPNRGGQSREELEATVHPRSRIATRALLSSSVSSKVTQHRFLYVGHAQAFRPLLRMAKYVRGPTAGLDDERCDPVTAHDARLVGPRQTNTSKYESHPPSQAHDLPPPSYKSCSFPVQNVHSNTRLVSPPSADTILIFLNDPCISKCLPPSSLFSRLVCCMAPTIFASSNAPYGPHSEGKPRSPSWPLASAAAIVSVSDCRCSAALLRPGTPLPIAVAYDHTNSALLQARPQRRLRAQSTSCTRARSGRCHHRGWPRCYSS